MTGGNRAAGNGPRRGASPGNGKNSGDDPLHGGGPAHGPNLGSRAAADTISAAAAAAAFRDALRGATRSGLLMIRWAGGRGRLKLVCPACGVSLGLRGRPSRPMHSAQRIDRFVGRHVAVGHISEVADG